MESTEYGETDLHSIIEGDNGFEPAANESLGEYGFSKQEFDDGELVDVEEEEEDEEELFEIDEILDEE